MKYVYKIILNTIILLLIIACGNNTSEKQSNTLPKDTVIENSIDKDDINVQLNGKNKWVANPETTSGIKKMQYLMSTLSDKESTKAYASLKEELQTEFTNIFNKCTMKGEAHNQLHNYLKPMIGIFEGLESTDLNVCKTNFNLMHTHLDKYKNYFE
jgi:hypothetical protein